MWLLADYLSDLGGRRTGDALVAGEGWTATLVRGDKPPGGLGIGRVTVTIEGPAASRIMLLLREKAMRGGG